MCGQLYSPLYVRVCVCCLHILVQLLTFGAHASQRVTVVGCVCVCVCPVQFFHTVTNRPRRPTDRLSAAIDLFKTCFFVKQPLRKATEFALKLLTHLPASLLALAGA